MSNFHPLFVSLVLGCSLGWAAIARADVVPPGPADCPPGSFLTRGHAGARCVPTTCETAENCALFRTRAWECAQAGLCVRTYQARDRVLGPHLVSTATGTCTSDDDCSGGATCEIRGRCLQVEGPPRFVRETISLRRETETVPRAVATGCGATGTSVLLVLALLGAGAAVTVRRERAREGRDEAVRALLLARGRATRAELIEMLRGEDGVGRALAPLATRVQVDADDDEIIYSIAGDEEEAQRRS